mgnify:CR=1 FL=1
MLREIYVFLHISPIEQAFVKVIGYTDDPSLVFQVQNLLRDPLSFQGSLQRLHTDTYYDSYSDKAIVDIINELIGSDISSVDELLVQKVRQLYYKK